jgi:uncharacterized protein (DUF1015 family)
MSQILPFRALRPAPEAAATVASVPYDVVSVDEARALARGNPLSFLHVTRAEIDLPPGVGPYDAAVYAQAARNFEDLKRAAPMVQEDAPSLYFYRLRMGAHVQTGVAGCFSLDEYDRGLIKKHEKTRPDKEDDRTRHMIELRAQTGVVFLTHRASPAVGAVAARTAARAPLYDFTADGGVRHTIWRAHEMDVPRLVDAFAELPALYIADGHHRAASAARARTALALGDGRPSNADAFIAVAFPDSEVQILPYNRVVKDLGGSRPEAFLASVQAAMTVTPDGSATPRRGEASMYLGGKWYTLTLPGAGRDGHPMRDAIAALDVERLQRHLLSPILGIGDPRTDKRLDFVGGIRGPAELERLVRTGQAAVAFALHPVSVGDLVAIADAGGIMPPKSTWFEPKLRDGLLVHLI